MSGNIGQCGKLIDSFMGCVGVRACNRFSLVLRVRGGGERRCVVEPTHATRSASHGNDAESLAHGEGRERAVLVDALEQVQPLELCEGELIREIV